MRLIRALNSSVIDAVRAHLIPEKNYPVDQQMGDLKYYMKAFPQDFQALTLWDDEKDPFELMGFMLSYIPQDRKHLFILQAWVDLRLYGTEWTMEGFRVLRQFAIDNGLDEIRAETQRSPKALLRRWGFDVLSQVLSYDIDTEI